MIAIFELGSLWFWLFIVIASGSLMAIQENSDSPGGWSTFCVVLTFIALYFLGAGVSLITLGTHILHNPVETLVYFLLYIVVGVIWSFHKWKELVDRQVKKYKLQVDKEAKYPSAYSKANWDSYRPEIKDNTGELFNWIFYWPFSVAWFVIHEPIERLFRFIMRNTKKIYEGITDRAYRNTLEFKTPKQATEMIEDGNLDNK